MGQDGVVLKTITLAVIYYQIEHTNLLLNAYQNGGLFLGRDNYVILL
jgi:hypothetical protein